MKVLFVGSHLDKGGGQALQTLSLFRELRKKVEGTYLCLRSVGPHRELLEEEGVRVVGTLRMPRGVSELRSAIRAEHGDWDIVQLFDVYYGLTAAYLARAFPRVVLLGTDPVAEVGWRYGSAARTVARLAFPELLRGTRVIVNSPSLVPDYQRFAPLYIPNAIDAARFEGLPSKEEARRRLGLDPEARTILWVGKVLPVKRVDWLFEILRRIPEARLVAVGGYEEEHYGDRYLRGLRAQYRDVADRATFPGEVGISQVALYLAAADVFAFPSRFEGMPNAVMEAMAAAVPVVASDIPAHRTLLRPGETGFLARDPDEFADRTSALFSDADLRNRIGAAAQSWIRSELTFERVRDRYLALYREVMNASS